MLLSILVVRDVQQRAQAAAGLGSLEGPGALSDENSRRHRRTAVGKRATVSRDAGAADPRAPKPTATGHDTDAALAALQAFLAERDEASLPTKHAPGLAGAREQLRELPAVARWALGASS
jgi:hypothetical protein